MNIKFISKWILIFGYLLVGFSIFVFVIIDLLPVDLPNIIAGLFSGSDKEVYYKVVPTENRHNNILIAFLIGLVLICVSKFIGILSKRN